MDPVQVRGWIAATNDVPIMDKVKGKDQTRIFIQKVLGMPRQNLILELELAIPRDSTVRIASNLEESEGTHQRSSL